MNKSRPNNPRLKSLEQFSFLFITFALLLFTVAFLLNRSHHATTLKYIRAGLSEELGKAAAQLEQTILDKERSISKEISWDSVSPEDCLKFNLYSLIQTATNAVPGEQPQDDNQKSALPERRIVPAFLRANFQTSRSQSDGRADYTNGLAAMQDHITPEALEYFSQAGEIPVMDAEDLDIKISAHLYHLDLAGKVDPARLYYVLYLLFEQQNVQLEESRHSYFEKVIRSKTDHFEEYRNLSRSAWQFAEHIEEKLGNDPVPARMVLGGKIASFNADGNICVFDIDWKTFFPDKPNIRISKDERISDWAVIDLPLDILPGYKFWLSRKTFETYATSVYRQYWLVNGLLATFLVLIIMLTLGIVRLIRKENELAQLRAKFIATVSHELRTPLSMIQLYSETIFHDRVDAAKHKDYLQTIVAETQRLTGLVNNVVDFSRLESSVRPFQSCNSNISELCWNVIQEFRYRLTLEGFRIKVNLQPDVHAYIDPQAFCRVLFNLLDNAIKYSEMEKFISLDLSEMENYILLRVTDHGIGIPEDAKQFIYADFFRADDPRVASQRGSGIGLSVVKQLLDGMGASIQVENADPQGTVFSVTIPRKSGPAKTVTEA